MTSSLSSRSNSSLSSVSSEELPEVAVPEMSSLPVKLTKKMVRKRIASESSGSSGDKNASALACLNETLPSESESEWVIDEEIGESSSDFSEVDDPAPRDFSVVTFKNVLNNDGSSSIGKQPGNWEAHSHDWHAAAASASIKLERQSSPSTQESRSIKETPSNASKDPLSNSTPDLKNRSTTERTVMCWDKTDPNSSFHTDVRFSNSNTAQNISEGVRPRRKRRPRLQLSMRICKEMVLEMMSKTNKSWCWPFYRPIYKGAKGAGTGNIFDRPIYLSEIKTKIMDREYTEAEDFVKDMKTLLENFLGHFPADHDFHKNAKKLQEMFEKGYRKLKELDKNSRSSNRRSRVRELKNRAFENQLISTLIARHPALHKHKQEEKGFSTNVASVDNIGKGNHSSATRPETNNVPPEKVESNRKSIKLETPECKRSSTTTSQSAVPSSIASQNLHSGDSRGTIPDKRNCNDASTPISVQNGTVPKRRIDTQSVSDSISKKIKATTQSVSMAQNEATFPIAEPTPTTHPCDSNQVGQGLVSELDFKINLDDKASLKNFGCQWLMIALKVITPISSISERIGLILGQHINQLQESKLRELEPEKLSAVAECILECLFPSGCQTNVQVTDEVLNQCSTVMDETRNQWLKMQSLLSAAQTSTCEAMVQMQKMQEHGIKTFQRLYESRSRVQEPSEPSSNSK
ncbi:unnamed protein product [Orchesella dallaii]|uniref:Bromo domain-containing protein n=1 Tax=Orchesella dallaii TaxID=48710 RepID=A0ABP1QS38_9HEXA